LAATEFVCIIDPDDAAGTDYTSLSAWWNAMRDSAGSGTLDLTNRTATNVVAGTLTRGAIGDDVAVTQTTTGATAICVHHTATQMLLKTIATATPNASGTWYPTADGNDTTNAWTPTDAGNPVSIVASCRASSGTSDTTAVTATGIVSSHQNKLILRGELTQATEWDATKYNLTVANNTLPILAAASSAVWLEGMQLYNNSGSPSSLSAALGGRDALYVQATNCVLRGGRYTVVCGTSYNPNILLKKCLIYGGSLGCVRPAIAASTIVAVNCTAIGATDCYYSSGVCVAINCYGSIASGANAAYRAAAGLTMTVINSASSDTSGTAGLQEITPAEAFIDPDNGDYSINAASPLYNVGQDLGPVTRWFFDVSSVYYTSPQNKSTGAVLFLTNSSTSATMRFRDFTNNAWLSDPPDTTITLPVAFSGTTQAVAFISDIHIGEDGTEDATKFAAVIHDIDVHLNPASNITAVCVLGDLVRDDPSYYADYLTAKADSDVATWYEIGGNHDVYNVETGDGHGFEYELGYTDAQGYLNFDINNCHFWLAGPHGDAGSGTPATNKQALDANSLTNLASELAAHAAENMFLCTHLETYDYLRGVRNESTAWITPIGSWLQNIAAYPWVAHISAHLHGYNVDNPWWGKALTESFAPDVVVWSVGAHDGPELTGPAIPVFINQYRQRWSA